MAGLNHDFLLVSREEHPPADGQRQADDPRAVRLHDDLVVYIFDTLAWVPAWNPSRNEPCLGLCQHGVTVIQAEGASLAARVFACWADLFGTGPKVLRLTGNWTCVEGGPCAEGEYDRLELDRDEVVASLRRLADHARQVAEAGGRLQLLHFGI